MNITALERQFLAKHTTGATSQTPLNQLRKEVYSAYISNTNQDATLKDLELQFLRKIITDNGGTPTQYVTWQEAAQALGFEAKYESDAKVAIYINLP